MKTLYLSNETNEVLETGKAYRNESYGVSNVTNLEGVIKHELLLLGNSDTSEFVKAEYGLPMDISDLNERLQKSAVSEAEALDIIHEIRKQIQKFFGHTEVYLIWVGTRASIEENYHGKEEGMTCYDLSGVKVMPICDLGDQGVLLVLDKEPGSLPFTAIESTEE